MVWQFGNDELDGLDGSECDNGKSNGRVQWWLYMVSVGC